MGQLDHAQTDRAKRERSDTTRTDKRVRIDFQTDPSRYRHWKLKVDGDIATLVMDVDEKSALFEGYDLKLNSYDLGVDIELADAIERLRFEHPTVRALVLRSACGWWCCARPSHGCFRRAPIFACSPARATRIR